MNRIGAAGNCLAFVFPQTAFLFYYSEKSRYNIDLAQHGHLPLFVRISLNEGNEVISPCQCPSLHTAYRCSTEYSCLSLP